MGSCFRVKVCKLKCLDKKLFMLGVKKRERKKEKGKKKIKERVVKCLEGVGCIFEIREV